MERLPGKTSGSYALALPGFALELNTHLANGRITCLTRNYEMAGANGRIISGVGDHGGSPIPTPPVSAAPNYFPTAAAIVDFSRQSDRADWLSRIFLGLFETC